MALPNSAVRKVDFNISIFEKGTDLIDTIKKDEIQYDILLLDVDMPNISGLEVAKILRENIDKK